MDGLSHCQALVVEKQSTLPGRTSAHSMRQRRDFDWTLILRRDRKGREKSGPPRP
jgi:hypothetical protein